MATVPVIAVSDNMAAVPDMIRQWVGGHFTVLGTDGFGRSDTREALRRFFEIDGKAIALAALSSLGSRRHHRRCGLRRRLQEGVRGLH